MQNARARQKQIERKRRKRQAKRRVLRQQGGPRREGAPPCEHGTPPWPKVSDTLYDFAEPLISRLPQAHGTAELEEALLWAIAVWNTLVIDQQLPFKELRVVGVRIAELLQVPCDTLDTLACELMQRKQALFPHDNRRIMGMQTGYNAGGYYFNIISAWTDADVAHFIGKPPPPGISIVGTSNTRTPTVLLTSGGS